MSEAVFSTKDRPFKLRVVADAAAYGRGWRKPRACPAYVFVARDRGTEADFALD